MPEANPAAPIVVSLAGDSLVAPSDPPRTLVSGMSFDLREGDRLAVVGPNGCGKSLFAALLGDNLVEEFGGSGGSGGRVAQRRELSRGAIALGLNELATLDDQRRYEARRGGEASVAAAPAAPLGRLAAFVSFESQRCLLHVEALEFAESRFTVVHKRATIASFLFPALAAGSTSLGTPPGHPNNPAAGGYQGYLPTRTRLAPLAVPYDAGPAHPLLAGLETAFADATSGDGEDRGSEAARLLTRFGLFSQRHQPLYTLSTGEMRKLMVADALLDDACRLLVLDEAEDGLDKASRAEFSVAVRRAILAANTNSTNGTGRPKLAVVHISHQFEDVMALEPTHALVLTPAKPGMLSAANSYKHGTWEEMAGAVEAAFETERRLLRTCDGESLAAAAGDTEEKASVSTGGAAASQRVLPSRPKAISSRANLVRSQAAAAATTTAAAATNASTASVGSDDAVLAFRGVNVAYEPSTVVLRDFHWEVRAGETWCLLGANGAGKSTIIKLITGESPLGFRQELYLFGRKKGSGESIWDIKRKLGILSASLHMVCATRY